jgi:hypothetical protein
VDCCDLADYRAESLEGVGSFDVNSCRAREWFSGMVSDDKVASIDGCVNDVVALLGLNI